MASRNYLLNCEILHEIRGRIRIRSRALKHLGVHKEEITKRLMQVHYIKSVEISTITGSVLIYFDNFSLTGENFVSLLQNTLNGYLVDIYKNEKKQASNKYVIERRLQEESPKEIMKNIGAAVLLLLLPGPKTKLTGIRRLFNYKTISTISLALPVLKNGILSLIQNKRPNADTLSSTAIVSSIALGSERTALTIMILERIAELLTAYTMKKTRGVIKDMLSVGENYVWKASEDEDQVAKKVPIEEIKKGDLILVQTGEKISVDGTIEKGSAVIDQSAITGEYMPVKKETGQEVFAGTLLKSGNITVRAEKVGDDRTASRIIKLVEDASFNKADIQSYADAFSAQLIPLNFLLAGIVYASTRNLQKALSMLVIDYSCGIRLSTATAFSASINTAAKNGILIKGSNYLEELSKADTVIFDKTGTITEGKPKVQTVKTFAKNMRDDRMIALAAAAEETSTHPLASAILNEVRNRGLKIPRHKEDVIRVARGIETYVNKDIIRVGSRRYMEENNISVEISTDVVKGMQNHGEIVIYVAKNENLIGVIGVSDPPRENIKKAMNRLRNQGIDDIVLLTGDLRQQAETIANSMSMDRYESELLPEDKAKDILKFRSIGSKVIMIGDGINDAPALSYANVGIALGSTRTDVAMEAADVTITSDDPLLIPAVIGLAKNTVKIIKQNFAMAIGINSFALVLGATGLLPAIYSSVLHNSITILVVGNSLRLLKYDVNK